MGFDALIRGLLLDADSITESLNDATVLHWPWLSRDVEGSGVYPNAGIPLRCLVEFKQRMLPNPSRPQEMISQVAVLTFVRPIAPNGAAGRREPIDNRDLFTLPNGYLAGVIAVDGFIDAGTHAPYLLSVSLG